MNMNDIDHIEITGDDLLLHSDQIPQKPELTGREVLLLSPKNQLAYANMVAARLIEEGQYMYVIPPIDALGGYYSQNTDREIAGEVLGTPVEANFVNMCTLASTLNCLRYMGSDTHNFSDPPSAQRQDYLLRLWKRIQDKRGVSPLYASSLHDVVKTLHDLVEETPDDIQNFYHQSELRSPLRLLWTLVRDGAAVITGPGLHGIALIEIEKNEPHQVITLDSLQDNPRPIIQEVGFIQMFGPEGQVAIDFNMHDVHLFMPKHEADPAHFNPWQAFDAWMQTQVFPTQPPFQFTSHRERIIIE